MRTIVLPGIVVVVACSNGQKQPEPGPEPAPAPETARAAPPVPPASSPAPAAQLDPPCLDVAAIAGSLSEDPELAVDTIGRFDLDGDGEKDSIVSVQWKADLSSHVFLTTNGCSRPAGTFEGEVTSAAGGVLQVEPLDGATREVRLVDGRFVPAGDVGRAPLVVETLRWFDRITTVDLADTAEVVDRDALARVGAELGVLADHGATAEAFRTAAAALRSVSLAAKRKSAASPPADLAMLEAALGDLAVALDAAAPLADDRPADAWAKVTPAALHVYQLARSVYDDTATAFDDN